MIVVVSGMPGCGSTTTARLLAKKLKLKFFSVGAYTKKIMREDMKIDKKETERSVDFWKTKRGKSKEHHVTVERMQEDLAKRGDIVIEGKISIRFIKNADFRIWLKAPLNVRAKRYVKRDNLMLKDAMRFLKEKQRDERENWKKIYGFDYFIQEKEADLIIDTMNKKPEEIVKMIINSIKVN
ncbi:MAG: cytidylate kinase family protein [Candidatus Aenigmatarchaeota archaeon]